MGEFSWWGAQALQERHALPPEVVVSEGTWQSGDRSPESSNHRSRAVWLLGHIGPLRPEDTGPKGR